VLITTSKLMSLERRPYATKVLITEAEDNFYNVQSNVTWKARSVLIGRHRPPHNLLVAFDDLTRTQDLELKIEVNGQTLPVTLPAPMHAKLIEYFQTQPNFKTHFDCSSFAHFINDIPYFFSQFHFHKWSYAEITSEEELAVGNTIAMCTTNNVLDMEITHLAIYLGHHLYLSKFGPSGKLVVATLAEMRKSFEGDFTFKLTPRLPATRPLSDVDNLGSAGQQGN
jgi:hypothetical protein